MSGERLPDGRYFVSELEINTLAVEARAVFLNTSDAANSLETFRKALRDLVLDASKLNLLDLVARMNVALLENGGSLEDVAGAIIVHNGFTWELDELILK